MLSACHCNPPQAMTPTEQNQNQSNQKLIKLKN